MTLRRSSKESLLSIDYPLGQPRRRPTTPNPRQPPGSTLGVVSLLYYPLVGLVAAGAEREPVRAVRSVPRSASVTVSVEDHASALGRAKPMARRAPRAFLLEEVSEKAFFLSLLRGAPIARVSGP